MLFWKKVLVPYLLKESPEMDNNGLNRGGGGFRGRGGFERGRGYVTFPGKLVRIFSQQLGLPTLTY